MQRYAIESTPARVYEGCCTWFTILALSARQWNGSWLRKQPAVFGFGPVESCFRKGPEPETDKRPPAAAAVPLPCKDPPGGHRDSDGPRPAESRPLLPVGWKSLIHSKLRLVDHANSTGLFLVTLLLSVTSILCSGLVLLSDLFFNKTTSSSDSSWSCLGHLTGESTLFI